jgi:hypothetical protein
LVALSGNRIAWQYHSDDGNTYRVAAQKALTDQAKLGGEAWAGVVGPKPAAMKMRRITISDGSGNSRVVPVYSTDAAILVAGTAMNVNVNGNSTSLTSSGNPIPETHFRKSVTKQAS